jgi:hypothetical protein
MINHGAQGTDHVSLAFGDANPEVAMGELLEQNKIVTLVLGAAYEGYVSYNQCLVYTGVIPDGLSQLTSGIIEQIFKWES